MIPGSEIYSLDFRLNPSLPPQGGDSAMNREGEEGCRPFSCEQERGNTRAV